MDLQQIRYIVALAEERHFQHAAKRVHVSQPTLSQQVKKLELELGHVLFERTAKGTRLTEAGKTFLPHAVATLDALEKGIRGLQQISGKPKGLIRVAAIPTLCPYLLPQVIARMRRVAPEVTLEIHEETTSVLVDHLKTGRFDLGLLALPIEDKSLVNLSLGKEPFLLALRKDHPLAARKRIRFELIKNDPVLLLQEGHCFRDQAMAYCEHFTSKVRVKFQGSSLTSVLNLTVAGEGITFVPRMAADKRSFPGLRFIPFQPPEPEREIGMIWRLTAPLGPAHQVFIQCVREHLQKQMEL